MDMNKYIGKTAYINQEGPRFGKKVTITQVIDSERVLVMCDYYDKSFCTIYHNKDLTIQLQNNK